MTKQLGISLNVLIEMERTTGIKTLLPLPFFRKQNIHCLPLQMDHLNLKLINSGPIPLSNATKGLNLQNPHVQKLAQNHLTS